jgi:UDP-hydrolysing UDP-N-acetyl-D-glucosamine 2-epimerase
MLNLGDLKKFKLVVYTSSRSDFGLLEGVILALNEFSTVELFISGAHTITSGRRSLEQVLDFCSSRKIKYHIVPFDLDSEPDGYSHIKASAKASERLADHLRQVNPDLLIVLGDRWELFSISLCALLMRVPIAHISGGETTMGAFDDSIRHAHTKLSALHFVACREYAKVVSLLGEEDWRIVISGESGLDWIHGGQLPSPDDVRREFCLPSRSTLPLLLVTYHPTSYGDKLDMLSELSALTVALADESEYEVLITGPGLEQGSQTVREHLLSTALRSQVIHYVEHLGRSNYLSLMRTAAAVVGNSSSGIVEAPSLGIPSVDIGSRQKGRIRAASVRHCEFSSLAIKQEIKQATKPEFRCRAARVMNPYDPYRDGKNSYRIAYGCVNALETIGKEVLLCKGFDQSCTPMKWDSLLE